MMKFTEDTGNGYEKNITIEVESSSVECYSSFYTDLESFVTHRVNGTPLRIKITSDIK